MKSQTISLIWKGKLPIISFFVVLLFDWLLKSNNIVTCLETDESWPLASPVARPLWGWWSYVCLYLFVCLFVYLFVCLFVYLFVLVFDWMWICLETDESWPVASPVRPMRSCHHLCVFCLFILLFNWTSVCLGTDESCGLCLKGWGRVLSSKWTLLIRFHICQIGTLIICHICLNNTSSMWIYK